eukprot:g70790.t1
MLEKMPEMEKPVTLPVCRHDYVGVDEWNSRCTKCGNVVAVPENIANLIADQHDDVETDMFRIKSPAATSSQKKAYCNHQFVALTETSCKCSACGKEVPVSVKVAESVLSPASSVSLPETMSPDGERKAVQQEAEASTKSDATSDVETCTSGKTGSSTVDQSNRKGSVGSWFKSKLISPAKGLDSSHKKSPNLLEKFRPNIRWRSSSKDQGKVSSATEDSQASQNNMEQGTGAHQPAVTVKAEEEEKEAEEEVEKGREEEKEGEEEVEKGREEEKEGEEEVEKGREEDKEGEEEVEKGQEEKEGEEEVEKGREEDKEGEEEVDKGREEEKEGEEEVEKGREEEKEGEEEVEKGREEVEKGREEEKEGEEEVEKGREEKEGEEEEQEAPSYVKGDVISDPASPKEDSPLYTTNEEKEEGEESSEPSTPGKQEEGDSTQREGEGRAEGVTSSPNKRLAQEGEPHCATCGQNEDHVLVRWVPDCESRKCYNCHAYFT